MLEAGCGRSRRATRGAGTRGGTRRRGSRRAASSCTRRARRPTPTRVSRPGRWLPMWSGSPSSASRNGAASGARVDEDHALPHVDRPPEQRAGGGIEVGELRAALRDDLELAVEVVAPTVVRALDLVARCCRSPSSMTMPRCRQRLWNARSSPSPVADDHDRRAADGDGHEVAGVRATARHARRRARSGRTRVAARGRTTRHRCTRRGSSRNRLGLGSRSSRRLLVREPPAVAGDVGSGRGRPLLRTGTRDGGSRRRARPCRS